MLFNSLRFVLFFVVVTALHYALPRRRRWMLLLAASTFFYTLFVPAYVLVLLATIAIDYVSALWIERTSSPAIRKYCLYFSVASVCAILFFFKYLDFFDQNLAALARVLRWNYSPFALKLVLPIGLSFHTFQSLSYVIEVYRGRQRAERHFGIYALYVMYFPQLVAGPIERPQNLLPQFWKQFGRAAEPGEATLDWRSMGDGLVLALWGLFKKVVVADSLALYVDAVYGAASRHNGTSLLVATYFFAIQIYCDFSGYSDIARGISRIYGIELMKNFETPYFSASIAEFWTRWHISLSTWFRDYVYVPLGGSRVPLLRSFFNIAAVFVLSGLWHGANWTFVLWGALNGFYLIAERAIGAARGRTKVADRPASPFVSLARAIVTFHLVSLSWIFFRADHLSTAFTILHKIATQRGPLFRDPMLFQGALGAFAVLSLELVQLAARRSAVENGRSPAYRRLPYAVALVFVIVLFGIDRGTQFIYFQF